MNGLFWNKVAGAVLATFLIILGVKELAHILYHTDKPEVPGFVVEVTEGADTGPAIEEGPPDFGTLLRNASVEAGERVARKCVSCHEFQAGGANLTGPALYGVMGNLVAEHAGFNYSSAMQEYAQGGTRWLYQNMYDYLENPRAYVPGTAMSFAGLRKQDERINIIAYMRSLDDNPLPLPEPAGATEPVNIETEAVVDPGEPTEPALDQQLSTPEGEALESGTLEEIVEAGEQAVNEAADAVGEAMDEAGDNADQ